MHTTSIKKSAGLILLTTLAVALSGCGMSAPSGTQSSPTQLGAHAITGTVHGGQNPVTSATIQLYAVGITGLKSSATPLITSVVQTDAGGNFNISGDWNCTSNTATYGVNPLLYIVATGGNPGISANTNNSALTLMAALGPCSSINSSTTIMLDEVTTVAAVVALTPFMSDYAHVGAQGASATGLVNAFATANTLANVSSGTSPGGTLASTVSVPSNTINALADILSACVNSSGPGAPNCSALFSAATSSGTVPVDTVTAMLNINGSPANNAATLFRMIPPAPPFATSMSSAPNDWSVALKFTGGGLSAPTGIALDASGNAWIANAGGNSVTGISNTGVLLTGPTGYSGNNTIFGAQAIAVDKSGNVWVADTLLSSIVELTVSGGAVQSSASYTAGGISGPSGIAIDSQNNVWISNFAGGSVTELNSSGAAVGGSPLTAGATLQQPAAIAVDPSGNVWVADSRLSVLTEFANNQTLLSGSGDSDGGLLAPIGIASDASGRAIVADSGSNAVSVFAATGTALATSPVTSGGLSQPAAVAIDGQGLAWVANAQTAGSLSQINVATGVTPSPSTGLGVFNQPEAIAIDASGNVWTANAGDNSISMVVGLAAPVPTPLVMRAGP